MNKEEIEEYVRAIGWIKYEKGQVVIPPDEMQEWWYHRDAADGDWYNSPAEIFEFDLGYPPN